MAIWKNLKFGKKLEICVGKVENFEKIEIWGIIKTWKNLKFGKINRSLENFLEICKIFRYLEIFGNYSEIWTIENLEIM